MPQQGGDVILFQHLFWFYSHPAVYIMAIPGLGAVLEIVPVFARKPLFAYPLAALSFVMIGVFSFMVWAHHMFVSGMADFFHIPIMLTTELISVPTGIVFLSAIGTIWMGRIHFKTPMLWVFGFLWAFVIGGITGVYLADVPTDITLSDTYFVVAHFHYTIIGSTIYGLFAGTYYWFPKITGRMYNERLGKLHFWWFTLAFNATFLPMFWLGIEGMRRRVADYPAELGPVNLFVSFAALNIALSVGVFLINMVRSWQRGPQAAANPWRAQTLEWQVSSPPPIENFDHIPTIDSGPYQYGDRPDGRSSRRRRAGTPRAMSGATLTAHGAGHGSDHEEAAAANRRLLFGVKLGILSEVMLFGAFFAAYFVIRAASPGWPPTDLERPELLLPSINTVLLVTSSVTLQMAVWAALRKRPTMLRWLAATLVLGSTFVLIQAYEFMTNGFGLADGVFGSTFYILTGFHGAHVIVGLLGIAIVANRTRLGLISAERHTALEAVSYYWHFVDVVWLFLLATLYIL